MSNIQTTEPKKLTAVDDVKKNINLLSPQFKAALPPHVSVEKFVRTVLTAVQTTPALVNANRQSLYSAAMKSASAGLLPDGREAALVPFKDQVQFMPMVSGILKQLRNSGELASIAANQIFTNDKFRYHVTVDGEILEHEPLLFGDRGAQLGVYALAKLKDGSVYVEVMTMQQIEDVRKVSRAKDNGPWAGPFRSEMEKKTVIRRLSKRLPISTDKAPALDSENEDFNFAGRDVNIPEQTAAAAAPQLEAKPGKKSRMSQVVKNHAPGASNEPAFDQEVSYAGPTDDEPSDEPPAAEAGPAQRPYPPN